MCIVPLGVTQYLTTSLSVCIQTFKSEFCRCFSWLSYFSSRFQPQCKDAVITRVKQLLWKLITTVNQYTVTEVIAHISPSISFPFFLVIYSEYHVEVLGEYRAFQHHKVYVMTNYTGISSFSLVLGSAWKPLMEVHINTNRTHACITGSINGFTGCARDKMGCRQREEKGEEVEGLPPLLSLFIFEANIVYCGFHLILGCWFSISRPVFLSSSSHLIIMERSLSAVMAIEKRRAA